jgi:hypothetical protein
VLAVKPAGVDKGKGGKFAMPSSTHQTYALLRSNPASGSDAGVFFARGARRQRVQLDTDTSEWAV